MVYIYKYGGGDYLFEKCEKKIIYINYNSN